jgi:hypothetical protein
MMDQSHSDGFAMNPEALARRVGLYLDPAIAEFGKQKTAYVEAEGLVASRARPWLGGYGGTGRMQEASNTFLDLVGTEVSGLVDTQQALITALEGYAAGLRSLARTTRLRDDTVQERFQKIARDMDAGQA